MISRLSRRLLAHPAGTKRCFLSSFALCRELPDSFADALTEHSTTLEPVNMDVARQQHDHYVSTLQTILPRSVCLTAQHELPDSLFVEDAVVTIGRTALLMQPGHASRRPEIESMRDVLTTNGLFKDYDVMDMAQRNPDALCDGGDVLWTGRHLFVGLSERTNKAALDVFRQLFPDRTVLPVPLPSDAGVLHLKSAVTHLDDRTLLAPTSELGTRVLSDLRADELGYTAVRIPDVLACNAVVLENNHVLLQDTPCQESRRLLQEAATERQLTIHWVDTSELAKKDAALTCCSVLFDG